MPIVICAIFWLQMAFAAIADTPRSMPHPWRRNLGALMGRTLLRPYPAGPVAAALPRHRAIVALDIEQSTRRPDTVKAELRRTLYGLFDEALLTAGIGRRHRDRFIDRGDGILALIHPVDQAPKALLLNRAVPALAKLLADYNAGIPPDDRPHRQLRVRVVVHAGEVHYDANGCFGEALDIAFRLLDAPSLKKTLLATAGPLILVVSEEIYRTIVRHGYDGIDQRSFRPLVRVQVASSHYTGWVHVPQEAAQPEISDVARSRQRLEVHLSGPAATARSQPDHDLPMSRRPQTAGLA